MSLILFFHVFSRRLVVLGVWEFDILEHKTGHRKLKFIGFLHLLLNKFRQLSDTIVASSLLRLVLIAYLFIVAACSMW